MLDTTLRHVNRSDGELVGSTLDSPVNAIQVAIEPPLIIQTGVVEPSLYVQCLDGLDILCLQLKVCLDVFLDLSVNSTLGNNRPSVVDTPSQNDLHGAFAVLVPKLLQQRLVDHSHHM